MLKRSAGIALKLAASAAVIALFFFISARMPYFGSDQATPLARLDPVTARLAAGNQQAATLTLSDGDARFSGNFFDSTSDGGFEMREVDVAAPCAGAGERYLAGHCPHCNTTPGVTDAGEPATLLWIDDSGTEARVGTIYRDCALSLANGMVRVPLLAFSNQQIALDGNALSRVPTLANADRTSQMNLGNWTIAVDEVAGGMRALAQMSQLLQESGWQEVSQGEQQASEYQRVFASGEARLCVVTLNQTDGAYQLVTMMNI